MTEGIQPASARLLEGLKIVELSSFVAAPLGGMTLAQLGADVIRIDPVGGGADINRWPVTGDGLSLYWVGLNKAKRSLTVDLRSDRGRELVTSLICDPDHGGGIVLTNAGRNTWLSYEALSERRPDLIHVQIDGKHDGSPAVDYTINAATGFPMITGPVGWEAPVNHVLPAWDVACGLYAAVALLSAELRRSRTGEGAQLRVPLEDVALATAGNLGFLAEAQVNQVERPRIGNHLYGSLARDFPTRDGQQVMIVALTKRHWRDLLSVTGLSGAISALETALEVDLSSEDARYRHREAIAGLLEPWFAARDFAEVSEELSRSSVLWSGYRTFTDLIRQHAAAGPRESMLAEIDQPGVGRHLAPGSPIIVGAEEAPDRPSRAPVLGEHSELVLRQDLGLAETEVRDLMSHGVVGGAGQ